MSFFMFSGRLFEPAGDDKEVQHERYIDVRLYGNRADVYYVPQKEEKKRGHPEKGYGR